MIKNFLSFFGLWRNSDMHMICTECKGRMDIEDISSDHSALSILQKAAKKLNEAQKSGIHNGPVMN